MSDNEMRNDEYECDYDCNLAVYLNLPEYFHDTGEKLQEHYYFNLKLIKYLENTPYKKNCLIEHIRTVLNNIDDYGKTLFCPYTDELKRAAIAIFQYFIFIFIY